MKKFLIAACLTLTAGAANAACPTTSLTFKDSAGTTQTLCFGGAAGANIPQHQILDSAGTNVLTVTAAGAAKVDGSAVTQPVSGTFWQATQPVSGTFWQTTQPVSGTFWQTTQPVSAASLPLPTGAMGATGGTVGLVAGSANIGHVDGEGTAGSASGGVLTVQGVASMTKLLVTPDSVSLPANQSVNVSQINGQTAANGGVTGSQLVEQGCAGQTVANTSVTPFSLASTTSLKLVSKVSAKKVYICSINLISATAQNVALIEGTHTTTDCDTSTAGLAGGTTAATGWNLAANGGLTLGNGQGMAFKSGTVNLDVCLLSSSTGQISGSITWAQF